MYNGIGLQTPRGSGTSGHVQASKFLAKPRPPSTSAADGGGTPNPLPTGSGLDGMRKPNKDILEHDRKRRVELRLVVLRDAFEEQGYTEAEIEERVEAARKAAEMEAEAEAEEDPPRAKDKRFTDTDGHHAAPRKENQLQIMRAALGLDAEDAQKKGDQ
nr:unnamed protein product [Digitaria exilis]